VLGPKFPITEAQIDALVATFYVRAREHAVLGPIFLDAVGADQAAWTHHEAKIASFWRNAIGIDRSFSGNPMLKHLANKDIVPDHFADWLTLFHEVAQEVLPDEAAAGITALADRIGKSLKMGLVQFRQKDSLPPRLLV